MAWFSIFIGLFYLGLVSYIVPRSSISFDIFKIKFRLLPHWVKYVSLAWLFIASAIYLIKMVEIANLESFCFSNLNLVLFSFLFSKQKQEDEFSEQIRNKSFTYSFVSFVATIGFFMSLNIFLREDQGQFISTIFVGGLIAISLLMSLVYFYITLYKLKKENN